MDLSRFEPGFDAHKILHVRNSLSGEIAGDQVRRTAHFHQLVERLRTLPGVEAASAVNLVPPLFRFPVVPLQIVGQPSEPRRQPTVQTRKILPDYFRTMGIPLLEGRPINAGDRAESLPVAVVNAALVKQHLGESDPNGTVLFLNGVADRRLRVVGVVGNVRSTDVIPELRPVIYLPFSQSSRQIMSLVIRATGDPRALARTAEREVRELTDSGNVYGTETLGDRIEGLYWRSRLASLLLGAFAILDLALGGAGIYGVVSFQSPAVCRSSRFDSPWEPPVAISTNWSWARDCS